MYTVRKFLSQRYLLVWDVEMFSTFKVSVNMKETCIVIFSWGSFNSFELTFTSSEILDQLSVHFQEKLS